MSVTHVRSTELAVDPTSSTFADDAVRVIRKFGLTFVPNWLGPDELAGVRAEFDGAFAGAEGTLERLTDQGKDLSRRYGETTTGEHLKYDNDDGLSARMPATHELFNRPVLRQVANGYLGWPNTLNRHVILTNDYRASDEIISYHFDEIGALKFLVYLDDVGPDNGPFQAVPGSHAIGSEIRKREWMRVDDFNLVRIRVFEQYSEELFYTLFGHFKPYVQACAVPVYAPAGTLLMFDTDTIHRAGLLADGQRRRVVRGSTYRGLWANAEQVS